MSDGLIERYQLLVDGYRRLDKRNVKIIELLDEKVALLKAEIEQLRWELQQ